MTKKKAPPSPTPNTTVTGRTYATKGRAKGAAAWRPQAHVRLLLAEVLTVLATYSFAITVRQIFYVLVGKGVLTKDEQAYARLGYMLGRARRSGEVRWEAIADDSLSRFGPDIHPAGARDFFTSARDSALTDIFCDWTVGQKEVPIVWTESEGMASSLRSGLAGLHWPVEVVSTSGSDSIKPKRDMAVEAVMRFKNTGQVTVIGHVGDLDEAGLSILDALAADLTAFCTDMGAPNAIKVEWVALTPGQVSAHSLPTNPGKQPKESKHEDGRLWSPPGGTMAYSVQAEALDPNDLLTIVDTWLRTHIDLDLINGQIRLSAGRKIDVRTWLWSMRNAVISSEDGIECDDQEPDDD
jgi:hypothetical protein